MPTFPLSLQTLTVKIIIEIQPNLVEGEKNVVLSNRKKKQRRVGWLVLSFRAGSREIVPVLRGARLNSNALICFFAVYPAALQWSGRRFKTSDTPNNYSNGDLN